MQHHFSAATLAIPSMCRMSIVRLVIFQGSPFESQWDDQVISPRREDWRSWAAEKYNEKMGNTPLVNGFTHFTIVATVGGRAALVGMLYLFCSQTSHER
jgi:hypothetical protein